MLPLMTGRGGLLGAEPESALRNFLLEFKLTVIDFFSFHGSCNFCNLYLAEEGRVDLEVDVFGAWKETRLRLV